MKNYCNQVKKRLEPLFLYLRIFNFYKSSFWTLILNILWKILLKFIKTHGSFWQIKNHPIKEWFKLQCTSLHDNINLVEAVGVEPTSEDFLQKDSPSADSSLNFPCITRVSNSYTVAPLTPSAMTRHRVRLPANLKPGYSSRHLAGLLPN